MIDPRILERIGREFLARMLPPWRGACAGQATSRWFVDDIASKPILELTETIYEAMSVCARCPYRRQCLEYAFEAETRDRIEWWSGETREDDRRYGIYGGIPGIMRERYAERSDRIEALEAWFIEQAEARRWMIEPGVEEAV